MSEAAQTLRLAQTPARGAGRALGLCAGDLLVAVNGRAFQGDVAGLQATLAESGSSAALTFRRGAAEFTVLAATPVLGVWEAAPAPAEDGMRRPFDPALLQRWEVMRGADGRYDLIPMRLPLLGLAVPQLWLMQQRLWLPAAMLVAAVVAGVIVHPWLALAVQAAGAAHLRGAHAAYLRQDRRGRGLAFHMVLAARGEAAAHAAQRALFPEDRYLFARAPRQRVTAAA